jgi:hypothetical protein
MHVACRDYKCIQNLVGKPEGKRALARPGHRWEYIIRMALREKVWKMCIEFIWVRMWTNGALLCAR